MEPNTITYTVKPKSSAKDFFLNLGAIVAMFTVAGNLINLLFTAINKAFPLINSYSYYYNSSSSISFPVATLIIFFPIYILLMWLLEKSYASEPEKRHVGIRKWLTFITLFIAGLAIAGDLVTVLYYFIDGQELTVGFLMKILVVLVLAVMIFLYYISDLREKLTSVSKKIWLGVSVAVILFSIVWGFSVLGSPRTQQLLKYDNQKVSHLVNLNSQIQYYYDIKGFLPQTIDDLSTFNSYLTKNDSQTGKPYEYIKISETEYSVCAVFNKNTTDDTKGDSYQNTSPTRVLGYDNISETHPAGRHCFNGVVTPIQYTNIPMLTQ